jgi:hypothetical protein
MPARLLLIERIDSLGAHPADTRPRLRAAGLAGWSAFGVALHADEPRNGEPRGAELEQALATSRPDEVWVAGSRAGWDAVRDALRDRVAARWWPCVVPGTAGEPEPAAGGPPTPFVDLEPGSLALETAIDVATGPRARVPLWDGDFVLVPGTLSGTAGRHALEAYARVAAERPELDLVVLDEATPELLGLARERSIHPRVHFAGSSPREAERTWIATAAAVLLPLDQPVSAGLVVRILAAGTALVPVTMRDGASALGAWLDARIGTRARSAEAALEVALDPSAERERMLERGRALATSRQPESLAAQLRAPDADQGGRVRAAA